MRNYTAEEIVRDFPSRLVILREQLARAQAAGADARELAHLEKQIADAEATLAAASQ